ncbi:porin family protein [Rufibacter sp. XAAS-G3-1]|uniref:porin family protein n=1 Tax=Rufibacter sp. XAAS-G3-1 TaxID=2729134 RepID=UPI0015E7AD00|nr:porin family protein [Rufibacter sp. XAAS-G3-1]
MFLASVYKAIAKKRLLGFLLLLDPFAASAQSITPQQSKISDVNFLEEQDINQPLRSNQVILNSTKSVGFGIKAGINYAHMNFDKGFPKPSSPIESSWKLGLLAGFFLEVPLIERLSLQQEYVYTSIRGKVQSTGINYKQSYLSLPFLLKYKILSNLSLVAGPQVELLIEAKQSDNKTFTNTTHDTEERSLGLTAGLEVQIHNNLIIDTRFMHGLNHIGVRQQSSLDEFKYEVVQVSINYTLNSFGK